ncbi:MAG: 2-dehydropantoate 2-reductase [bacterium]
MRIYIDFDDVLCETAQALSTLAKGMFGRDVPYENIEFFDLQRAFSLTNEEIDTLMVRAHETDFLLSLNPIPHAVSSVQALCDTGHNVVVVTGRQSVCHEGTAQWLLNHGLGHLDILYVDKYKRAPVIPHPHVPRMLNIGDLNRLHFDVAIDDSPTALDLLTHRTNCQIIVFDRPWNQNYEGAPHIKRAFTWQDILACL